MWNVWKLHVTRIMWLVMLVGALGQYDGSIQSLVISVLYVAHPACSHRWSGGHPSSRYVHIHCVSMEHWLTILEYHVIPCRLWFKGLGDGE